MFAIMLVCSYMTMWFSNVNGFFLNADVYGVDAINVSSTEEVFISKILLIIEFIFIVLLSIKNAKYILSNKRTYIYFSMVFLCFFLVGKSQESLSYITSISMGSVQLGPYTLLGITLFFYAYNPNNWNRVKNGMHLLLLAILLTTFHGLFKYIHYFNESSDTSRYVGLKWFAISGLTLQYLILFPLVLQNQMDKKIRFSYLIACLGANIIAVAFTQTRLLFLSTMLNVFLFLYKMKMIKMKVFIVISFVFFGLFFISNQIELSENNLITSSVNALSGRAFQDTRSENLILFMNFISVDYICDFLFGHGYTRESGFVVDSGILNTLFMVGIPMFTLAVLLLILPVFKSSKIKLEMEDAVVWAAACTWIVRFILSSTMVFNIEFLIFIVFSGRCAWLVDQKYNDPNY